MPHSLPRHSPLHCVLPPHLIAHMADSGTPAIRERALGTLLLDQSFRMSRTAIAERYRRRRLLRRLLLEGPPTLAPAAANKQRSIYSAGGYQRLPGTIVRQEGSMPSGDLPVDEAYDDLGRTYDLYFDIYNRNSIDGSGMVMKGTVHFGTGYDNAFWNGRQMVFGDGDSDINGNPLPGALFNRFTIATDVTAHELTHGVTEHEAGLIYWGQPGALNESLSDVFGSLVKQRRLNQTAGTADWLIGAGLFTAAVNGTALRSMQAPGTAYDDPILGTDPQPAHMSAYVRTLQDNGGVHINSGIPNHAFYNVAIGIGGFAWDKAGRIWYETLRSPLLRSTAKFQAFAQLTLRTAGRLYGSGSTEHQATRNGWALVGINV